MNQIIPQTVFANKSCRVSRGDADIAQTHHRRKYSSENSSNSLHIHIVHKNMKNIINLVIRGVYILVQFAIYRNNILQITHHHIACK